MRAKSADEAKAVVRYARHPLDIDEVRAHIEAGKLPTKLALTWDDRVSFVLTEGLQLKKISLSRHGVRGPGADDQGFDTDVAIATGELTKLIPDLVEALGGEGRSGNRGRGPGRPARRRRDGPARRLWTPTRQRAVLAFVTPAAMGIELGLDRASSSLPAPPPSCAGGWATGDLHRLARRLCSTAARRL